MTDFRDRPFWAREQGRIEIYRLLNDAEFVSMAGEVVRIDHQRRVLALTEFPLLVRESRLWRVADSYRQSRRARRLDIEAIEREIPIGDHGPVWR